MTDIVLDLETFGLAPDSAIVSIGAVNVQTGAEFYQVVDAPVGSINAKTVDWWLTQRPEVREALAMAVARWPHSIMLVNFTGWLNSQREARPPSLRLWGSEDFDTVILRSAYERAGLDVPWHYQEPRGLRTCFDLLGVDEDAHPWEDRIEHIAIDCARQAALILKEALK